MRVKNGTELDKLQTAKIKDNRYCNKNLGVQN